MNITSNVTANTDGTHTISWVATQDEGSKLHDLMVSINTPVVYIDGVPTSQSRGIYVWADWNNGPGKPNYMAPEFTGERTLNLASYIGPWTALEVVAYICQFKTPDSEYDQVDCSTAPIIPITNPVSQTPKPNKGKGKNK